MRHLIGFILAVALGAALFFGAGVMQTDHDAGYLVKAFPVSIRYEGDRVVLACTFPMPFLKSAAIELTAADDVQYAIKTEPLVGPLSSYFHATYRDHGPSPERGQDLVLLDTRDAEGGGDWSGNFVGTSFIFSKSANLTTLEGDPRFYFDDSQTPQAQGTGTEEWGGGGDYWGGRNMTLPLAGHPNGAKDLKSATNEREKIDLGGRSIRLSDMTEATR